MQLDRERIEAELNAVATVQEMAAITGLSRITIYGYVHNRWLDLGIAARKGRAILIHKQTALDWVNEHSRGGKRKQSGTPPPG